MGAARKFPPATLRLDGQTRRGFKLSCGWCQKSETVAVNTMSHAGEDQESHFIRMKFSKSGWKVGDRESDDRCPGCFAKILSAQARNGTTKKEDGSVVELRPKAKAEIPKEMQLDDRRIIFSTINERYLSKDKGYQDGWSDVRVSTDLGVPLEWVQKLRQENFGPEGANEQLRAELAAAKAENADLSARLDRLFKLLASQQETWGELEQKGKSASERIGQIEKMLKGDAS